MSCAKKQYTLIRLSNDVLLSLFNHSTMDLPVVIRVKSGRVSIKDESLKEKGECRFVDAAVLKTECTDIA